MKMIRNLGILGILIALTGCAWPSAINKISDGIKTVSDKVDSVKAEFKKADTNQDGKVDASELKTWLFSGGGLALVAGILLRNRKSKEEKDEVKRQTEGELSKHRTLLDDLNRRLPPTG